MANDSFQALLGIYRTGYQDGSNGFHRSATAGKIAASIDQLSKLSAEADRLVGRATAANYPTAAAFRCEADGLNALFGAQRAQLATLVEAAKAEDGRKISAAGTFYQADLRTKAAAQQQADATLLGNLDQLAQGVASAFTAAASSLPPGPPTPVQPVRPIQPIQPAQPGRPSSGLPLGSFEQRMADFFLRAWPDEAAMLGDISSLTAAIRQGSAVAKSFGLASDEEISRFLLATIVFGPGFEREAWAAPILGDGRPAGAEKIDHLQAAAAERLIQAAVGAPGASIGERATGNPS